jgi:hypothetical protein
MTYEMKEELKQLSTELLGASSRWQVFIKKPTMQEQVLPNGQKVKVPVRLNAEQVLVLLRNEKNTLQAQKELKEIQEKAGNV